MFQESYRDATEVDYRGSTRRAGNLENYSILQGTRTEAFTVASGRIGRAFQERASYMIDIGPEGLADLDAGAREGFRRFIRREPLGAVLALAPWNYPYRADARSPVWRTRR